MGEMRANSAKSAPHLDARSAEAAEMIRDCFSAIRHIQSQVADTGKLDEQRKRHVAAIAHHQKQIDDIDDLLVHGELRIAALRDQILEAQQIQQDASKRHVTRQIANLQDMLAELRGSGVNVAELLIKISCEKEKDNEDASNS